MRKVEMRKQTMKMLSFEVKTFQNHRLEMILSRICITYMVLGTIIWFAEKLVMRREKTVCEEFSADSCNSTHYQHN
jgi:hypothetical protein